MYINSYRLLELEKPGVWTGYVELKDPKKKLSFEDESREVVELAMAKSIVDRGLELPEQLRGLA